MARLVELCAQQNILPQRRRQYPRLLRGVREAPRTLPWPQPLTLGAEGGQFAQEGHQLPEQSRLLKRSHAAADTSAGGPAAAAKVSAPMRGGGGEAGDEAAKSGGGVLRVVGMHCK